MHRKEMKVNISSAIIKTVERSERRVNQTPNLEFSKIKERILENYIDCIKEKGRAGNQP
jgi:predicted house-cleaning NTP pyrophosphatase (Maf/HAM1 superfamily)